MDDAHRVGVHMRIRAFYFPSRRIFVAAWLVLAVGYALSSPGPAEGAPEMSLGAMFRDSGPIETDGTSFLWLYRDDLQSPEAGSWYSAVFLARSDMGALRDVFVADFKVTSDGRLRRVRRIRNLSRTRDGDEDTLACDGAGRVAFSARASGMYRTVALADFDGEPAELTEHWTHWQRLTSEVTNYQRTGRTRGAHWSHYLFSAPPKQLRLRFIGRALDVEIPETRFQIDTNGNTQSPLVVKQEMVKAPQAPLAWAVDTARAVPWIGKHKIAWLEKHWFAFLDWLARTRYAVTGDVGDTVLPDTVPPTGRVRQMVLPDWPPPDTKPILEPALPGEGQWRHMNDELFAAPHPGPPLFYTSFLRPDPERPFAKVYMTVWDSARVELHMIAGVREPVSTTGMRGTGQIPRARDSDHLARLIGAFNGAFQSLHGEWGMVLDRKALLPPKPFGATVAVLRDGRVAMGTWPNPGDALPEDLVDLRQNLLPLIDKGAKNPFKLKWWGSAPQGFEDRVFTIRTALCLTRAGKMVYFFGEHLSSDTLGDAMIATGCEYGIHMDMNPGHCGFEYYRVDPEGAQPTLNRPLEEEEEAEGVIPRSEGLFFRSKKLVGKMRHMRFPRYVGRDPRDFFYLIKRKSIFDNPPTGTKGWSPIAPESGVPVAAAFSQINEKLHVYKIDLDQTEFFIEFDKPEDALVAFPFTSTGSGVTTGVVRHGNVLESLRAGEPALRLNSGRPALLGPGEPQEADDIVQGVPRAVAVETGASVALAMDSEGFLVAAQSESGKAVTLFETVAKIGGKEAMALLPPDTVGAKVLWLSVKARPKPAWERIFKDVKPVPPSVWREVYRQRGRLLDHGDEDKDATQSD
ncbi:MAG: hypothetical protein GY854_03585 [Deltaproteobacteria bacterium]|nr:hypothetical protein [Deltaproteobacteria bacterium]